MSHLRVDLPPLQDFTGFMRTSLWMVLAVLLASGCAGRLRGPAATAFQPGSGSQLIVTPETRLIGKVVTFDPDARFAVLNFPIGHLPVLGQRLSVYRLGLKVGEIKVTGPQRDDNIVGDVTAGDARKGDEVREQ